MERSAGLVVFRRENEAVLFLLLHYEAGHWDFPKGHVEHGESDMDAALRELKEETGISDVRVVDGFRGVIHYFFKSEGKNVYKEVVFFLGEAKEGEIKLSFEHVGFEWLPFKEAFEKITYKSSRDVLRKAAEFLRRI